MLSVAAAVLLGCAKPTPPEKSPLPSPFVALDPEGVIVDEWEAKDFAGGRGYSQFFTPAVADIGKLEAALPAFLKIAQRGFDLTDLDKRAASYGRQYVGVIIGGRRHIVVHAYCHIHGDLLKTAFHVEDGGDCIFQVQYDVESGAFLNFRVNRDS